MEESFELLSSMSPKIKGRQPTLKIKTASKLALKKHFSKCLVLDQYRSVKNEDLAVVELSSTDSSESKGSSKEGSQDKDDIVIIDSENEATDCKNNRVQQWVNTIAEDKKTETFFSQVSTIFGDDASSHENDGNKIAACSSFKDCLTHRFDELFVSKRNGIGAIKETKDLSDDSFSLGINISLTSKLNKSNTNKERIGQGAIVIDETLLTSDESIPHTPDCFVSTRRKTGKLWNHDDCLDKTPPIPETPKTPANQSVQEVESMLDSLYGKKWRQEQQRVLRPMSEPKKKQTRHEEVDSGLKTERALRPPIKENLCKKINFDRLRKPVESPWLQRLNGLVDSDSDSNKEDNLTMAGGLKMVKTRLDFNVDSPIEKISNGKENVQPDKTTKPQLKKNTKTNSSSSLTNNLGEDYDSTDEEYDKEIEILEIKRKSMLPKKNNTYSFLESLSECVPLNECHMSARIFRSSFIQYRQELTKKLFDLYNEKVFENALPEDTQLEWNLKLRKTAGLCYCKKITRRNGNVERQARITLSTKVLDSADRLRDTLIHEMCHAATWIVNKISDGHGTYWKSWAFKAMEIFPELPPIKRCHAYAIKSKYTYKCTDCGYSFGRHTKSLDIERKRCGHCYGKFELLLNRVAKNGEVKVVPVTPRKEATGFALFVKENYALYKDPSRKHGDVMKILGHKFAEIKIKDARK